VLHFHCKFSCFETLLLCCSLTPNKRSDHLHRYGVNMRFLGQVRAHLETIMRTKHDDNEPTRKPTVLMEMVAIEAYARAIKVLVRRNLRALKVNSEAAFYEEIVGKCV
jgi:hypothetical protein